MKIQQFCVKQFQEGRLLKKSRPHWGVTHSVASSLWARFHLRCTLAERVCFFGFCLFFIFEESNKTRFFSRSTDRTEGLRWSFTLWQLEQVPMQTRMWADKSRIEQSETLDQVWWPMMTHDDPWWLQTKWTCEAGEAPSKYEPNMARVRETWPSARMV
jgi:hypothetical protein